LLQQGLLTSEMSDGYSILKLNTLSREVLRKQRSVEIAVPVKKLPERQEKPASTVAQLDPESEGLFQHLRALRKQFADEQGVPPYVIFSDATLRALAEQRPQSQSHFAQIPGIGSRKLEAYFAPFTYAIRDYCEAHNLVMGLEPVKEEKEQKRPVVTQVDPGPSSKQVTLDLYNEGRSIEDIARERNLTPGTIIKHLTELIEVGEHIDIERLVPLERHQIILNALQQVGDELLKPVKEFLGEEYSYDEIRLVRAVMRQAG
jgi:ATP-dependent DNA helicase RecQ